MLQKVVYPYEYIDGWEKFNETSLPEKEDFYSQLIMEDITGEEDAHAKKVSKDFEIKFFGEYYDLYGQSFRSMCLRIYELDPARFLSTPELAWQAALKKTKVKLDLLTDVINGRKRYKRWNMSLYRFAKANNKYM